MVSSISRRIFASRRQTAVRPSEGFVRRRTWTVLSRLSVEGVCLPLAVCGMKQSGRDMAKVR
ncbi:hypothetical protein [Neisseria elongata]|uniref:hypothetical protein n=1 Tax=Neisseria elongata TaxID=495 RepID=UPI00131B9DDB|nr:hypothetical protein [Neisseria elongata]